MKAPVPVGSGHRVQGAGFGLQASSIILLEFQVSSFEFRVSGDGVRMLGTTATAKPRLVQVQRFRVSGFLSCFGFEVKVSDFGKRLQVSGFGFRV